MIGQTLSHFEITAKLGEGGMGAVYRANDTNLDRAVAIKVLPEEFTADAERLARFEREAKVLASLNHPNIASIYDLATEGDTHFLVLELVDGESLFERLERGAIPHEEALRLALQMIEGLDAAHARGIVHRDLKPANVMLTKDGTVKVLDFGLAKAWEQNEASPDMSHSPTLTAQMTRAGIILGTAAYMSPEQARGDEADQRADIWSFGVLLFEMLTGQKLFNEPTVSDTLAAVLRADLDLEELPADIPAATRKALRRCLARDPGQRLHSIADARLDLLEQDEAPTEIAESPGGKGPRSTLFGWPGLVGALIIGAVLAFAVGQLGGGQESDGPTTPIYANMPLPPDFERAIRPQIARDGSFVVFSGYREGKWQLYQRRIGSFEVLPIPGTESAGAQFLSPDGRYVGFFAEGQLKKVSLSGGDPLTLAAVTADAPGKALWLEDGRILFTPRWTEAGLHAVSENGGEPRVLTEPDREAGELGHWWPHGLPDGRRVLFTVWRAGSGLNDSKIAVLDLETGEKRILFDGASARYLPSGHVLYSHAGRWLVAPFDLDRLELRGEPVAVLEGAGRPNPEGSQEDWVSVSENGTVVYRPKPSLEHISWIEEDGRATPWLFEARDLAELTFSPDGRRAAVSVLEGGASRVWAFDPELGIEERLVAGEGSYASPVWHPDGDQLAFLALETGRFNVLRKGSASATPERLVATDGDAWPSDWTSDGRRLIYHQYDENYDVQLWVMEADDPESRIALTSGSVSHYLGTLSPDDRWLAYQTNETGRVEVYLQQFPSGTGRIRVSRAGGWRPKWSADGSELYYRLDDVIYAAAISATADGPVVGDVRKVLELPPTASSWDVTPDGRIAAVVNVSEIAPEIRLITNWTSQLSELAPPSE